MTALLGSGLGGLRFKSSLPDQTFITGAKLTRGGRAGSAYGRKVPARLLTREDVVQVRELLPGVPSFFKFALVVL